MFLGSKGCKIVLSICDMLTSFVVVAGLIIDAFGELRDQQEQVKEDMEVRVDSILTCNC